LVEKLSVKAPDAQMKLKILNAIAAEHDVKWEPKALEYEDPVMSMDLPVRFKKGYVVSLPCILFSTRNTTR